MSHTGAEFDPLAPEVIEHPYGWLAEIQRFGSPIVHVPALAHYMVVGYPEIVEILGDPATYSSANAQVPLQEVSHEASELLAGSDALPVSMGVSDPPRHAGLRGPAARAFTPRRVRSLEATVRQEAANRLARLAEVEQFDLVEELSFPLPANVIFTLLGVPGDDIPRLREWGRHRARLNWGRPTAGEQREMASNVVEYGRYVRRLIEAKSVEPGDDLTSDLLVIHREDPHALSTEDIASILITLSFAGHETTTDLITNTVRCLFEHPEQWQAVVDDPTLAPAAIEETLRFEHPAPVIRRLVTRTTSVGGAVLEAGDGLLLWLAAANRDPAVFADPEVFTIWRDDVSRHRAFGMGTHFCLGAHLARMEARTVLEELARARPDLAMVSTQQWEFEPILGFRGPRHLLVS